MQEMSVGMDLKKVGELGGDSSMRILSYGQAPIAKVPSSVPINYDAAAK